MLGTEIWDDDGIEGAPSRVKGLGLLNVVTQMKPEKRLALTDAQFVPTGDPVRGYEIHLGQTDGPDRNNAWLQLGTRTEGAASEDGKIMGCYLHGLFAADRFRDAYLARFGAVIQKMNYEASVDTTLDDLADHLQTHMDVDALFALAQDV